MDEAENRVLDLLVEAWNAYTELPVLHSADEGDFAFAIHAAQNIVMARPALRNVLEARKLGSRTN